MKWVSIEASATHSSIIYSICNVCHVSLCCCYNMPRILCCRFDLVYKYIKCFHSGACEAPARENPGHKLGGCLKGSSDYPWHHQLWKWGTSALNSFFFCYLLIIILTQLWSQSIFFFVLFNFFGILCFSYVYFVHTQIIHWIKHLQLCMNHLKGESATRQTWVCM